MGIEADKVPQDVRNALTKLFPDAAEVEWEMEATYEAEFKRDGREVEVNFTADGELLQIEYEMDVEDLPLAVVKTINREFPAAKITEAERVELPDGSSVYELDLKEGDEEIEVHVALEASIVAIGDDL